MVNGGFPSLNPPLPSQGPTLNEHNAPPDGHSPLDIHPLNLRMLKTFPLARRVHLTRADDILVDPDSPPHAVSDAHAAAIRECAARMREARDRGAAVW